ncbi:MAG: MBL fold metallo-hydrolase [Desulfobacterales bacterium]|nr:MBL fold metallo-hydrolase [Desulfobacterales bacterium]
MNIEIIGAESLGVRGLCCFVKTGDRKILIDPGIALGYVRHKLLPHPVQIALDEKAQKRIIDLWSESTDIVLSHLHGDHVPLADANPYQLNINRLIGLNTRVSVWAKDQSHFSPTEENRAKALTAILHVDLISAEEKKDGPMTFSGPVPHGEEKDSLETVIMTRIEEDEIFVHAPDIQLLDDETVSKIISWKPDIVLAGGPPLYLSRLSGDQIRRAWQNAERLCRAVDRVILDHHLMRSHEGLKWLKTLSSKTGKQVMCAADFMHKPRLLLEADRERLYKKMPVPDGWHGDYETGKATTDDYKNAYQLIKF